MPPKEKWFTKCIPLSVTPYMLCSLLRDEILHFPNEIVF
jgi:hypothetical protein